MASTCVLSDEELRRQQRLEKKAVSYDGDYDDDDDDSTMRDEREKKTGNRKVGDDTRRQQAGRGRTFCKHEGCDKWRIRGGVCVTHGAKMKHCSQEGCSNYARTGGVCHRHGALAKLKRCSRKGCANFSQKAGLCRRHGREVNFERCGLAGCTYYSQTREGLCSRHYNNLLSICRHEGCTDYTLIGAVCSRHLKKTLIDAPGEVELVPLPAREYEATTVGAVAGRGGVIEVKYPSDDEAKIGAWIWKSSRMARLGN
jgi:hypothetical protein